MTLVGTLPDGTVLRSIWPCEFEGETPDAYGRATSCRDQPSYSVQFPDGTVMNACEEHAQQLWDRATQETNP